MIVHAKHDGSTDRVIFMLHGTGGNENDLVNLARYIDETATLIGIRGAVEEQGMLRYFKRYADGSFDLKDLAKQTTALHEGMLQLLEYYKLQDAVVSVIGYSNGSNIAINLFKEFETDFTSAMLFHPSSVRPGVPFKQQPALNVYTTGGKIDPFIAFEKFEEAVKEFEDAGIPVTTNVQPGGHQLVDAEVIEAKKFYEGIIQ